MHRSCLTLVVLAVAACAGEQLTDQGRKVREILPPPSDSPCQFLGVVTGSEAWTMSTSDDRESALNQVRNQVAAMSGNAFVLTQTNTSADKTSSQADAYRCP